MTDLPVFDTFQMVEKVDVALGLDVYVDEDGDVWFVEGGDINNTPGPHFLAPVEVETIREALDDAPE